MAPRIRKCPSRLSLLVAFLFIFSVIRVNFGLQQEDGKSYTISAEIAQKCCLPENLQSLQKCLEKRGNPGMWFGPRLGKRARLAQGQPALQRLLLEALVANDPKAIEELQDHIGNNVEMTGTKRRFTPRLGRESGELDARHVEFVPRLGRELALSYPPSPYADSDLTPIPLLFGRYAAEERVPLLAESGVPPFAPRLGRQLVDLYSSLGYPVKEDTPRVARSLDAKKHKESQKNN